MQQPICIYHKNCADGFGAAWAVWRALGDDAQYVAASHGDLPPECDGRDVIIVDYSYKREVLDQLAKNANRVILLDHHISAQDELMPLLEDGTIEGIFDMQKSGAILAWEWFHPNVPAPRLLQHIQDRDLWRFELSGTREITAALFSYEYDFNIWQQLVDSDLEHLLQDGRAISRKHLKDVNSICRSGSYRMTILGHDVPVVNVPPLWSSDAGHILGKGEPFAVCYWDNEHCRMFSLRSASDGVNVAKIAAHFGGGGHQHAAGFKVAHDQLATLADKPATMEL